MACIPSDEDEYASVQVKGDDGADDDVNQNALVTANPDEDGLCEVFGSALDTSEVL